MYPNTECPHDCYKPGDCDGSCTHPDESEKCIQTSDAKFYNGGIAGKTRYLVGEACSDYVLPRPVVAPQQPRVDTNTATVSMRPTVSRANTADAFRNMFAILHNLSEDEWNRFETTNNKWLERDLTTFVLKLDDARLDALYALVQSRQPERYRDAA